MSAGFFFVALVVVVGGGYLWKQMRQKAEVEGMLVAARALGWYCSETPTIDVEQLWFPLLRRGHDRKPRCFVWGALDGRPATIFQHSFAEGSGKNERTYTFSCALLEMPCHARQLEITSKSVFRKFGEALGIGDAAFESEAFNDRYHVACEDQPFAFALLDPAMQQFLVEAPPTEVIATAGRYLFIAVDRIDTKRFTQLAGFGQAVYRQIPDVVFDNYGGPR
ncbi:MAG: hypothetical protein AB7L13_14020 [Acidimicrobiia bacterium]